MDTLSKAARSKVMSRVRSTDTKPEMTVRRLIHSMGYRYRLHDASLPGHPDLVFKSRKKVVFVHGCFWHLHPGCPHCRIPSSRQNYWKPKLERNAERDKRVQRELRALGWRSLVVWECELANDGKIARKIRRFLT